MKKLLSLCVILSMAITVLTAAPTRRQAITFTQPDGSTIEIMPWGDEFMSLYTDIATGKCVIMDETTHFWRPMTEDEINETTSNWTESRRKAMTANKPKRLGGAPTKGEVHLPVLLVQFSDLKFSEHYGSVAYFDSVFNRMDYDRIAYTSTKGVEYHTSSVRNYFDTQSLGKFDFQADIIGPITLSKGYAYYGQNSGTSKDIHFTELCQEAIQQAIDSGYLKNAKIYDGDNDNNVDIVYMIYAGWGENENHIADYIWAKTYYPSIRTPDNTYINLISASCELLSADTPTEEPDGIGVLVHEFGHALGLPDFYPVHTDGDKLNQRYGMDAWSVMDQGEYNGNGNLPGCYTVQERLLLGWIDEEDLDTVPTVGRDTLLPFVSSGKAMILRNPKNKNEYITLENHFYNDNIWEQCWGNGTYFKLTTNYGMLITHVDYVESKWKANSVNDLSSHQYCCPLPADGVLWSYEDLNTKAIASPANSQSLFTQWRLDYRADIFPGYKKITTLNKSNPYCVWNTGDSIDINITNIKWLANGALELTFGDYVEPSPDVPTAIESISDKRLASRKIMTKDGRIIVNGFDIFGRKR